MDLPFYREYDLPWNTDSGQERKFQRLLGFIFLGVAALGPRLALHPDDQAVDPDEIVEIPPRIATAAAGRKAVATAATARTRA